VSLTFARQEILLTPWLLVVQVDVTNQNLYYIYCLRLRV